ncbi:hypothetical protein [Haliangium sp.]|uniref:hypothetical protein n=1 Tax=Haliangium sp. TaxID=2663208 RepID=UPI003D12780C
MGLAYTAPPGYASTPILDNVDVAYDHAVVSADKRVELRFALRPYGQDLPPAMRTAQFSWQFFQTGIANLVHGGTTGEVAPTAEVPAEPFGADDAKMVAIRWFDSDDNPEFFGNGYELAFVVFIHREEVGDAYTFVLLKEGESPERLNEELFHSLRFAEKQ